MEAKRKCSDDFACAQFFKSGSNAKYFKCDATSEIKPSKAGSVLYPKGIFFVKFPSILFKIYQNV